jgi:outer membrane protein OmpA-like peptidoglycan-associated protein
MNTHNCVAATLISLSVLAGCQSWPEPGKGGVSETRSSEHYYITEIGYDETSSTLQYQLSNARLKLDMLILKGAKSCLPASVRTTARMMSRVQREIDGELLDDAYGDLVVLSRSLQNLRSQLAYVTHHTACAKTEETTKQRLLANMLLNALKLDIQFDLNNADLSEAYIVRVNHFIQRYQYLLALTQAKLTIHITAHTDTVGNPKTNEALADQRAEAVKSLLLSLGIQSAVISIINNSEDKPLLLKDNTFSHGLNRRVELSVDKADVSTTNALSLPIKEWEQSAPKLFDQH